MYIYITPQKEGFVGSSCSGVVEYYLKEDLAQKKGLSTIQATPQGDLIEYYKKEGDGFFNSYADNIAGDDVISAIDDNVKGKGLHTEDARFYNIFVNPSQEELKHITEDENALKEYTRELMKEYAQGFNRTKKNGKQVSVEDLVWFGKVEKHRYFSVKDMQVLHNEKYMAIKNDIVKETNPKRIAFLEEELRGMDGIYAIDNRRKEIIKMPFEKIEKKHNTLIRRKTEKPEQYQSHVHIIVSRCVRNERISLSPMAKHKQGIIDTGKRKNKVGFNRSNFKQQGEILFDLKFCYNRKMEESYIYYNTQKNGILPTKREPQTILVEIDFYKNQYSGLVEKIKQVREEIKPLLDQRKELVHQLDNGFMTKAEFYTRNKAISTKLEPLYTKKESYDTDLQEVRRELKGLYAEQRGNKKAMIINNIKDNNYREFPQFHNVLLAKMLQKVDPEKQMGINQNSVLVYARKQPQFKQAIDNIFKERGIIPQDSFGKLFLEMLDKKIDPLYNMKFLEMLDIKNIINMIPQKMVMKATELAVKPFSQNRTM